jgi:hypothetical protein
MAHSNLKLQTFHDWKLPITKASNSQMTPFDAALLLLVGVWLLSKGVRILRRGTKTTPLKGPATKSSVFGVSRFLREHKDSSLVYEEWAEQYGAVFRTPIGLGGTQVILCDPKAMQHFYSKETYAYVHNATHKILLHNLVRLFV